LLFFSFSQFVVFFGKSYLLLVGSTASVLHLSDGATWIMLYGLQARAAVSNYPWM
jgi:hypothetical protein